MSYTQQLVNDTQKNLSLKMAKDIETFESLLERELTRDERASFKAGFAFGSKEAAYEIFEAQKKIDPTP